MGERGRRYLVEVGLVFLASLVVTGVGSWVAAFSGALGEWIYLFVVLSFFALPLGVVRWFRREESGAAGMVAGPLGKSLRWGLALSALTVIPFAMGFHLWTTQVRGLEASFHVQNYSKWEEESQGRPAGLDAREHGVYLWSEGQTLRFWWIPGAKEIVALELRHSGEVSHLETSTTVISEAGDEVIWFQGRMGRSGGAELRFDGTNDWAELHFSGGPLREVNVGALGKQGDVVRLERSWSWLLLALMTQLLLVALPEEFFYRGYVQPTLGRVFKRRWRLGPVELSAAVVLASALFAVGHVAVDPRPVRLAVFFPSLVFGWMRERTGGIRAPILYHALCNLMVELAAVHYFEA